MTSLNPDSPALLVRRGRIAGPDGFSPVDLRLSEARIAAIAPAGTLAPEPGETVLEADDGIVLPAFVDLHTHLDKGHITPRQPNPDGSFMGALTAVSADRVANWTAADVEARMEFALRCAYAHGTAAIRTHLDSAPPQHGISWPVFARMRERWAGRIELQATALCGPDHLLDTALVEALAQTAKAHGGSLGGAISVFDNAGEAIANLIDAAGRHGLDLDLHIDESGDSASRSLSVLADRVIETGFSGRVLAGHCCSLAVLAGEDAKATIARVAEAGIAVVSLPMCNLYLQDRLPGRTPRWRGVTLLRELKAAGVAVSLASDNTRDPFYAYGDLDMLEVLRESVRIGHLDHPADRLADWFSAIAAVPARTGGFAYGGTLATSAPADLVVVRARTPGELFSRPQADRTVIRAGAVISARLPDYRDLDPILGVTS
ncbi:cytosine deaminase [Rhizobium sp. PP-F2F-G48]|uniref:cytosine deaminase n=1 Tax=Rhizobium sp. PP-F2F-G48 TaxID=2135651 RepID=UPI0010532A81|nr:cytosine deaminase [Rhizobium sp. PP-F2F-G48]TCM50765.1 cytosine deaminase [Rhizobium sp. PP-F2F-G48]